MQVPQNSLFRHIRTSNPLTTLTKYNPIMKQAALLLLRAAKFITRGQAAISTNHFITRNLLGVSVLSQHKAHITRIRKTTTLRYFFIRNNFPLRNCLQEPKDGTDSSDKFFLFLHIHQTINKI